MEILEAYVETPLIPSAFISHIAGCKVYLKLENTQPSGSFKSRGISVLAAKKLKEAKDESKVQFFSSSGGNAGLAAAFAARKHNRLCTVVVPKTTKPATISRLQAIGATTVVHGEHWSEANAYLLNDVIAQLPEDVIPVFCHPFDDEIIWEGHSTIVDELKAQLPKAPDAIVLSVGGGGLYAGVAQGLDRVGWSHVPVVAVETEGAASLNESVKAGKQVVLDKITSIASSLGSVYVPEKVLDLAKSHPTKAVTVTDAEASRACVLFGDHHKFIVEPACGASLAVAYENKLADIVPGLSSDSVVVVIVCGGSSTSIDDLRSYASR